MGQTTVVGTCCFSSKQCMEFCRGFGTVAFMYGKFECLRCYKAHMGGVNDAIVTGAEPRII